MEVQYSAAALAIEVLALLHVARREWLGPWMGGVVVYALLFAPVLARAHSYDLLTRYCKLQQV